MAKQTTSGVVLSRVVVDNDELVSLLRHAFGIPEGVELSAQACDTEDGVVTSNLGPKIDLSRLGLVISWAEQT